MINISSLKHTFYKTNNNCCHLITNLIENRYLAELIKFYPKAGFTQCLRNEGPKKHYSFGIQDIVLQNHINHSAKKNVSDIWFNFAEFILSKEYIDLLTECTNVDLSEMDINISFYKFEKGDWVSPHIDNDNKILTQIFYFNDFWSRDWGGYFNLLGSKHVQDVHFSVPPLVTFSVLIFRTDYSWHMVTPVTDMSRVPRLSVQVEFIK